METREEIMKRTFSEDFMKKVQENMGEVKIPKDFIEKMKNALEVSHYKYGWPSQTYPELAKAYKCAKERVELYIRTHNLEYLVDTANFLMLEYMFPAIEQTDPKIVKYKSRYEKYVAPQVIPDGLLRYECDGYRDYLVHSCAIAIYEYINPQFPDAVYKATDSSDSPGLAGGISYKELMEK